MEVENGMSEDICYKGVFKADPVEFVSCSPYAKKMKRRNDFVTFLIFALFATSIVFGRHPIVGNSMYPTYKNGQYAVAVRTFGIGEYNEGDVVIAKTQGEYIIKRVAGTPGDTVTINTDGSVLVNGEAYSYGVGNCYEFGYFEGMTENDDGSYSITLGENEYYVIGDNHENSADSRYFGAFTTKQLPEKVLFVI